MKRIIKLGVGPEKPGEIKYEAEIEAADAKEFAEQIRTIWEKVTRSLNEQSEDNENFLWITVEEDESGWADFDLEDEILEILDP